MTIPPSRSMSGHLDEDGSIFDPHRICLKIDADRRALRRSCLIVEASGMLGTFDRVVHDKAVSQMDLLMGAETIGRVVGVLRAAVNRKGPTRMVEADHILFIDFTCVTDANPFAHDFLPCRLSGKD